MTEITANDRNYSRMTEITDIGAEITLPWTQNSAFLSEYILSSVY